MLAYTIYILINILHEVFCSRSCTICMRFFLIFLAPKPECTSDPECPNHLACIQEKCQDPCYTNSCGRNAECKVKNHRAICVCLFGYVGDPYTFCEERKVHSISLIVLKIFTYLEGFKVRPLFFNSWMQE